MFFLTTFNIYLSATDEMEANPPTRGPNDEIWNYWRQSDGPEIEELTKYIHEVAKFEIPESMTHQEVRYQLVSMKADATLIGHRSSFYHLNFVRIMYHHVLIDANLVDEIEYLYRLYQEYRHKLEEYSYVPQTGHFQIDTMMHLWSAIDRVATLLHKHYT